MKKITYLIALTLFISCANESNTNSEISEDSTIESSNEVENKNEIITKKEIFKYINFYL